MRSRQILFAVLFALSVGIVCAQTEQRWVVLPQSEAKTLVGTDLSGLSGKITGTWQPLQGDVDALETKLTQVSQLSHKSNFSWRHVEHPEKYFRQYLGLVEEGRKLIYVQAFCPGNGDRPLPGWRNELLQISDGGNCIWHAVYDVAAGKFVAMSTNGLG